MDEFSTLKKIILDKDYETYLNNKIFSENFGYWEKNISGKWNNIKCDDNDLPIKIFKNFNEHIEFDNYNTKLYLDFKLVDKFDTNIEYKNNLIRDYSIILENIKKKEIIVYNYKFPEKDIYKYYINYKKNKKINYDEISIYDILYYIITTLKKN